MLFLPYRAWLPLGLSGLVSFRSFCPLLFRSPYPAPPEGFGQQFPKGHQRGRQTQPMAFFIIRRHESWICESVAILPKD